MPLLPCSPTTLNADAFRKFLRRAPDQRGAILGDIQGTSDARSARKMQQNAGSSGEIAAFTLFQTVLLESEPSC
jgi:hypothetical protein